MKNKFLIVLCFVATQGLAQTKGLFINKLTNINPVSYTDVIYYGEKDTALVSTYSGRIAKVIKGKAKEQVVAQVEDEIYALAYNKSRKEIIASTLSMGLIVIDERSGKTVRRVTLPSWANSITLSDSYNYVSVIDQSGKRYIFDIRNGYKNIDADTIIPLGRIVAIDSSDVATIVTSKKVIQWDLKRKIKTKEQEVDLVRFADMDKEGNFLSIDYNVCARYDATKKSTAFKISHPNWPFPHPDKKGEMIDIPYQMQLNAARFAKTFIYTAGIDRSVRVWDKNTGTLVVTLLGHKGSISKMKVSKNETQVVSVDLKGVVKFWDVK